jgi:hypothetical protein
MQAVFPHWAVSRNRRGPSGSHVAEAGEQGVHLGLRLVDAEAEAQPGGAAVGYDARRVEPRLPGLGIGQVEGEEIAAPRFVDWHDQARWVEAGPSKPGDEVPLQRMGMVNGKLRDELLNGEVFNTLREAQVLIEEWRRHYNRIRPHSSLGYRPPAPETVPSARSQISSGAGSAAMAHYNSTRTTRWGLVTCWCWKLSTRRSRRCATLLLAEGLRMRCGCVEARVLVARFSRVDGTEAVLASG